MILNINIYHSPFQFHTTVSPIELTNPSARRSEKVSRQWRDKVTIAQSLAVFEVIKSAAVIRETRHNALHCSFDIDWEKSNSERTRAAKRGRGVMERKEENGGGRKWGEGGRWPSSKGRGETQRFWRSQRRKSKVNTGGRMNKEGGRTDIRGWKGSGDIKGERERERERELWEMCPWIERPPVCHYCYQFISDVLTGR